MASSVDELLAQYRRHAAVHAAIDYADPSSVRAGNAAADGMITIAKQLAAMLPPPVSQFASLLDASDAAALWAAHHLVEHFAPDNEVTDRALTIVERAVNERQAAGDFADAMGERMWLDEWRKKQEHRTT